MPTATAPPISPAARKAASELGVDLSTVKGTGKSGAIKVDDVRAAAPADAKSSSSPSSSKSSSKWASKGYRGKQPWEEDDHGAELHHSRKPILTSGSGGEPVNELASLLHELGYQTSISRGENSFSILDDSIMGAVQRFRSEHGVEEDPSGFRDRAEAASHVGPWTWEALLRATGRA
jgi:hypothetical protein